MITTIIAKLILGLQANVCGGRNSKLSASQFLCWKEQDVIFDPTTRQVFHLVFSHVFKQSSTPCFSFAAVEVHTACAFTAHG